MANITASYQRSPLQYSRKDYLMLGLSANQDSNIAATNPIKFNTRTAGNMTFNPATYQVTLKANKTYALKAVHWASFSNANAFLTVQFYNVTAGAYISTNSSAQYPLSYAAQYSGNCAVFDIITPTVDSVIECRIKSVYNLTAIYAGYSFWEITEIENFAPAYFNYGQYAYVSPQLDLQITSAIGGFVLVRGKGIFKKTSGGIWVLDFNMEQSTNSVTAADFTITGILTPNVGTLGAGAVTVEPNSTAVYYSGRVNKNSGVVVIRSSAGRTNWAVTGSSIELASKPTGYAIPSDV